MIKFAISNLSVLSSLRKIPYLRSLFVYHLPSIDSLGSSDDDDEAFSSLRFGDVTGKQTARKRFFELDRYSLRYIQDGYRIHDVGVSSGITSLELRHLLVAQKLSGTLMLSDKHARFRVGAGKVITRVYDSFGVLRSVYAFGMLFDSQLSSYFFISKFLFPVFRLLPDRSEKVERLLLAPSVKHAIDGDYVEFREFDVFAPDDVCRYTFIRCMNVLNRSYFDDARILAAIGNLHGALADDGVLLVGRTDANNVCAASFYRKTKSGLAKLDAMNGGAEIDSLIARFCDETTGH